MTSPLYRSRQARRPDLLLLALEAGGLGVHLQHRDVVLEEAEAGGVARVGPQDRRVHGEPPEVLVSQHFRHLHPDLAMWWKVRRGAVSSLPRLRPWDSVSDGRSCERRRKLECFPGWLP